jgi:hypothetical protein
MALSLNELSLKTNSARTEVHNAIKQTRRPWQSGETVNAEAIEVVDQVNSNNYSDIAKLAVERARNIVEKNELMLNEIYQRRIGKDMRSLTHQSSWDSRDEQLFYLHDFSWEIPQEKEEGAFSKIKKIFTPRH